MCTDNAIGGIAYRICNAPRSWSHARERCEAQGMVLAQPSSPESMTALGAALKRAFWLGGSDRASEGEWRWTDGTVISRARRFGKPFVNLPESAYYFQSFGQLEVDFGRNCLRLAEGRVDAHACQEALPFVCQERPTEYAPQENARATCTSDDLGGHHYLICGDARTWQEAEAHCNRNDMHLATLQSVDEAKFIAERIRADSFIGLVNSTHPDFKPQFPVFPDSLERGVWRNLDDNRIVWCGNAQGMSTPLSYTRWAQNEPSRDDLACSAMASGTGQWRAVACGRPLAYVCEQIDDGKPDAFATRPELMIDSSPELRPGTLVTSPMLSLDRAFHVRACVDLYEAASVPQTRIKDVEERWYTQRVNGYLVAASAGTFRLRRDLRTRAIRAIWVASENNFRIPELAKPKLSERQAFIKLGEITGVAPEHISLQAGSGLRINRKPRIVEEEYELVYGFQIIADAPKLSPLTTRHYIAVNANTGEMSGYANDVYY
ncbi:MAG: C-type lectin domain-containing protein [Myxococcales bacterium]